MIKRERLEVRITKEQKELFTLKARNENLTSSALLRKIVLDYLSVDDKKQVKNIKSNKDEEKRENVIRAKVSNKEYIKINQLAKEAKLSLSDYMRKKLLNEKIIVVDGLKELAYQLRKIGNNLNQLTNLANDGRIFSVELESTKENLKVIWKELRSIFN